MLCDAAIAEFDAILLEDAPDLRARYDAAAASDPQGLDALVRQAARYGDLKTMVLAGEALERKNRLGREAAFAFAQALLALGRSEDALSAFRHPKLNGFDTPRYFLGHAQALAELGRPEEAVAVLDDGLRAAPGHPALVELRGRLTGEAPAPPEESLPGAAPEAVKAEAEHILAGGDPARAVLELGRMSLAYKRDADIRGALALSVGRAVLQQVRPAFLPGRTGKIVNLVMFSSEFMLLRMRLEEMSSWVDRFVIVEAAQTFTGLPKPLHFAERRAEFAPWADKIVHMPVERFPEWAASPWGRDFYQRDMGISAAAGLCGSEDYILETDADEIIDHRALEGFSGDYACLLTRVSRFFLNYRPDRSNKKRLRRSSSIFKAKHLSRFGVSFARFFLARRWPRAYLIPEAGWHFTSIADAAGVSNKIASYAHQEQTKAHFRDETHFAALLGRVRAGQLEPGWERAEIDDTFPSFVVRRRSELEPLIL